MRVLSCTPSHCKDNWIASCLLDNAQASCGRIRSDATSAFFSGRLWCENDGTYYFQARWWTLPEETAEGRKPWHARRELFRSNAVDENEVVVLLLLLFLQLHQPNLMLYSYGLFASTVPSIENLFLDVGGVVALFLFFSFAQIH